MLRFDRLNEVMKRRARTFFHPARVLAGGFLVIILLGTLLLSLPVASSTGKSVGFFNALFTATSSTCVTGLSTLDTGLDYTTFGHVVIMLMIEVGGLGFMLFATLTMVVLRRRITLHNRMVLRESMNMPGLSGGVRTTLRFALIALLIEGAGAVLLSFRFVPQYGLAKGVFYGLFHSVSAFCNAGFDLFGHSASLTGYRSDWYVLSVIGLLIITGGIGFAVIADCVNKKGKVGRLALHTKLVLLGTGALLLFGFLFFLVSEWNNPATMDYEGATVGTKLVDAWFQSVTVRTAGFDSVGQAGLSTAGKAVSILLMFIGASPASTGGGVKTTTIIVLILIVNSTLRGQEDINAFKRRLPTQLVRGALTILALFLGLMVFSVTVLSLTEAGSGKDFIDLLYEAVSAMATVGLSTASTPTLSRGSQVLILVLMYLGRVGPMTLMMTFLHRTKNTQNAIRFPEEQIIIG